MNGRALVLGVFVLALIAIGNIPAAHSSGSPAILTPAVTPTPPIQILGISNQYQKFTGTFWQNGTTEFDSGSSPFFFNPAFANFSTVTYATFSVGASVANFLQPLVTVKQGGHVILNNTGPETFVVNPPSATAQLTTTIPEAFLPGGGIPALGSYPLNETQQLLLEYQTNQPSNWQTPGPTNTEIESLQISAPVAVWLNSTSVFMPFPLPISVNYSSVNVSLGGGYAFYPYAQVTSNGVYLAVPSITPGTTDNFTVRFTPVPVVVGSTPLIVIKNYSRTESSPAFIAYGSWVNTQYTSWGGIYIISFQIPYTIDPTTVNISEGGVYLKVSQFIVSGDVITILPQAVITPLQATAKFTIKFDLPSAPASASITKTSGVGILGFDLTLVDLLWLFVILGGIGLLMIWLWPNSRRQTGERYALTYGLIVLIAVALILIFSPILPGS